MDTTKFSLEAVIRHGVCINIRPLLYYVSCNLHGEKDVCMPLTRVVVVLVDKFINKCLL